MKVFNNDRDETVRFRIEPRIGDDGIYLELKENGNRATTVFPPSDAPALALAILEAAVGESSRQSNYSERAIDNLRAEVDRMNLEDAEARERAELEAEALELFRASQCIRTDGMYASVPSFAQLSDPSKTKWLAVARRAREINKEEK